MAKANSPHLIFTYPSASELKIMKRDIDETTSQRAESIIDQLMDDYSVEEVRKMVDARLRLRDKSKPRLVRPKKSLPK